MLWELETIVCLIIRFKNLHPCWVSVWRFWSMVIVDFASLGSQLYREGCSLGFGCPLKESMGKFIMRPTSCSHTEDWGTWVSTTLPGPISPSGGFVSSESFNTFTHRGIYMRSEIIVLITRIPKMGQPNFRKP